VVVLGVVGCVIVVFRVLVFMSVLGVVGRGLFGVGDGVWYS